MENTVWIENMMWNERSNIINEDESLTKSCLFALWTLKKHLIELSWQSFSKYTWSYTRMFIIYSFYSIYAEMMMIDAMKDVEERVIVGGELLKDVKFPDQEMVSQTEKGL